MSYGQFKLATLLVLTVMIALIAVCALALHEYLIRAEHATDASIFITGISFIAAILIMRYIHETNAEIRSLDEQLTRERRERNEAERELQESEEKYRLLVENSNSIILRIDAKGNITFFNDFAQSFFGYQESEILGNNVVGTIIPPTESSGRDLERMMEDILRNPGEYVRNENENMCRNGERVWVRWANRAFFDSEGNVSEMFCVGVDITDRKRAEDALRLDEARFEALYALSQMGDASVGQIADFVVDRLRELTRSSIGTIGFLNEDESVMTAHGWSKTIMEQCRMDDKPVRFQVEGGGIWVQAIRERRPVIINDYYSSTYHKKGYPEGHVPISRLLVIPTFDQERIATIAMVANKEMEYDPGDARQVSLLMDGLWKLIQRKRAQESLRESETQLRLLSSKLLTAQEEERKRIALDLHDSIGTSLAAIKMGLQNALKQIKEGTAAREWVERVISMTQQTIDESHRIMTDLHPQMLDDLGVVVTVGWFCRQFQAVYSGIHVEFEPGVEEHEIPDSLKIVIFRIVQEALNNAAKYSNAERVRLSLTRVDDAIELIVEDDGDGFDPDSVRSRRDRKGGLGIASMKKRAELSGGTLSIESAIARGTVILAKWPILEYPRVST